MFGKKTCYLCGGNLSRGKCVLCGLDNTKRERRHYHLNERSATVIRAKYSLEDDDGKKACESKEAKIDTGNDSRYHSPKENEAKPVGSTYSAAQTGTVKRPASGSKSSVHKKSRTKKEKGNAAKKIRRAVVLLTLILSVVTLLHELFRVITEEFVDQFTDPQPEYMSEAEVGYDPYAFVERELAEEGTAFEIELQAGCYEAGVHLPEGRYTVSLISGIGTMSVEDWDNGIYLWESFGDNAEQDEITEMEDVRLYQGAKLKITESAILLFHSENGQTQDMSSQENPLTEVVKIREEEPLYAGKDFPAGVYDITIPADYASVQYTIPDYFAENEEDAIEATEYIWLDAEEGEDRYRNVVLPEGASIYTEYADIVLIPSEIIGSEDYKAYYSYTD
ncbi:MAG: hypothetical protein SOY12_10690 [Schaedlerella sp.]|nr:hypothetical protein [Lachnospiraceae bacterium]MDY4203481.1 hypothetical protein [Schaedlerella sp.]